MLIDAGMNEHVRFQFVGQFKALGANAAHIFLFVRVNGLHVPRQRSARNEFARTQLARIISYALMRIYVNA